MASNSADDKLRQALGTSSVTFVREALQNPEVTQNFKMLAFNCESVSPLMGVLADNHKPEDAKEEMAKLLLAHPATNVDFTMEKFPYSALYIAAITKKNDWIVYLLLNHIDRTKYNFEQLIQDLEKDFQSGERERAKRDNVLDLLQGGTVPFQPKWDQGYDLSDFFLAAKHGTHQRLIHLLEKNPEKKKVDLNGETHWGSAILCAAITSEYPDSHTRYSRHRTVQLLITHGADVNKKDNKTKRTPLEAAVWFLQPENVALLVQKGAQGNKDELLAMMKKKAEDNWRNVNSAEDVKRDEIAAYLDLLPQ